MGSRKEKNSRSKGFTLVELVVVLVILAILMAILVPSLVGYIRKAKVQQAFAECRSSVIAAQSIASEKYGKRNGNEKNLDWGGGGYPNVKKLAEVPDESKINNIETNTDEYLVTYLEYQTGDTIVIYERGHKPEYYLADNSTGGTAEKDVSGLSGYAGHVAAASGYAPDRWTMAREWLNSQAADGKGSLPAVSSSIVEKAGYGDKKMYWRPYYLGDKKNPQVIYYANSDDMKDADGNLKAQSGNTWNAALVMVNGTVYRYSKNDNSNGTSISDIFKQASTYDKAKEYLTSKGFTQVK